METWSTSESLVYLYRGNRSRRKFRKIFPLRRVAASGTYASRISLNIPRVIAHLEKSFRSAREGVAFPPASFEIINDLSLNETFTKAPWRIYGHAYIRCHIIHTLYLYAELFYKAAGFPPRKVKDYGTSYVERS